MSPFKVLLHPAGKLSSDRRGAVAMIFALALVPVLGIVGLSVDYTTALVAKSRFQTSIDASALAGVRAAKAKLSERGGTSAQARAVAVAAANQYLASNLPNINFVGTPTNIADFTIEGGAIEATISYTAQMQTSMSRLFGINSFQLGSKSTVSTTLPRFVNTYFLLDNSASMGLADDEANKALMKRLTSNLHDRESRNCEFACHGSNGEGTNYDIAMRNKVKLRIHSLRDAAIEAVLSAQANVSVPGQYKFEVRSFDVSTTLVKEMSSDYPAVLSALQTIDLTSISNKGNTLLSANVDAFARYFEQEGISSKDGYSIDTPQIVVVLVTDGIGDDRTSSEFYAGKVTRPYHPAISTRACDNLKRRGVKLVVVETEYAAITGNYTYDTYVRPYRDEARHKLRSCASRGSYFLAHDATTIDDAFKKTFHNLVLPARLID